MILKVRCIPKKSGGVRIIVPLPARLREQYRKANKLLQEVHMTRAMEEGVWHIPHAFVRDRSPVTNAIPHVGKRYTLVMDIEDYFPSVTCYDFDMAVQVGVMLGAEIRQRSAVCRWKAELPQGFPTSPTVANIASIGMDKWIVGHYPGVVYTRYADDMAFSSDSAMDIGFIRSTLPQFIKDASSDQFKINSKKTRLMDGKYERRVITGVSVGDRDIRPTRRMRRRLRAMENRGRHLPTKGLRRRARAQASGYRGWCRMTLPSGKRIAEEMVNEILTETMFDA